MLTIVCQAANLRSPAISDRGDACDYAGVEGGMLVFGRTIK